MFPELLAVNIRQSLLLQLSAFRRQGYRDLGLLYLGARYALSLGLNNEAVDWLQLLEKSWGKNVTQPSYLPIALLQFLALPTGKDRDKIITLLDDLLRSNPSLRSELSLLYPDFISMEDTKIDKSANEANRRYKAIRDAGEKLLSRWEREEQRGDKNGQDKKQTVSVRNSLNVLDVPTKLLQLSVQANLYYEKNNTEMGRFYLEEMLLVDGSQPETLRNLLTICSEQKDVEGYEKYWKKYVKLLLWKIFNNDDQLSSRQTLLNFYQRVVILLERECNQSTDKMMDVLNRPGFLSRWIEASAGIIWLTDFNQEPEKPGKEEPVISITIYSIPFIRFWLRVFYPEFTNRFLFKAAISDKGAKELGQSAADSTIELPYSPVVKFLSKYLKWYRFHFGMSRGDNEVLKESIAAYAGFVARIPATTYLYKLSEEDFGKEENYYLLEGKPLLDEIRAACGFGIGLYLGQFLDGGQNNWQGLEQFLSESNAQGLLSDNLLLYQALAFSRNGKGLQGLAIVLPLLSQFKEEDLDEDKSDKKNIWDSVLNAAFEEAVKNGKDKSNGKTVTSLKNIKTQIESIPNSRVLRTLKKEALEEVKKLINHFNKQGKIDNVLKNFKTYMDKGEFTKAKNALSNLPNGDKEMLEIKSTLTKQINQARKHALLQEQIEKTAKSLNQHLLHGEYQKATSLVNKLPYDNEQVREIKEQMLNRIRESEAKNTEINDIIEQVREHIARTEYNLARKVADKLRASHLQKLRDNILEQINEAEERNDLTNKIMATVQKHLANRRYKQARQTIYEISKQHPEWFLEMKGEWISQINERESGDARINKTMENIRDHMSRNEFDLARSEAKRLSGGHMTQVRTNLLEQINEAESDHNLINQTIEMARLYASQGDVKSARKVINNLPSKFSKLKENLLSQLR